MAKNTVARGDVAVMMLSAMLTEAGLAVLYPMSDSLAFDIAVYDSGRFRRVQVKRAFRVKRSADLFQVDFMRSIPRSDGALRRPYSSFDIDFVAAVIVERGVAYIMPIDQVAKVKRSVSLGISGSGRRMPSCRRFDPEIYLNKIDLGDRIVELNRFGS